MFSSIKADYPKNNYQIYLSDNLSKNIDQYLKTFNNKSILIIADEYFINKINLPDTQLHKLFTSYNHLFIGGGVESKNLNGALKILDKLNQMSMTRDGCIVAVGGGVIGDLCGFVASLYQRGISLVHVPTTLTSAVDSSIGGKTGINMYDAVNLLGTYFHPSASFIDLRFMKTLENRDFSAGVAESIKKSFIYDREFYNFIYNNSEKIFNKDYNYLYDLIYKSISIKLFHTISDEKEKSIRLLLNYGHTFGQAFESVYGINAKSLRHGEAVSLGMMCAAQMSESLYGNKNIIREHSEILTKYTLPTKLSCLKNIKIPNVDNLFSRLSKDKKRTVQGNRFVICSSIGSAKIEHITDNNLIKSSFDLVLQ